MKAGSGIPGNSCTWARQGPAGPGLCCQEPWISPRISSWLQQIIQRLPHDRISFHFDSYVENMENYPPFDFLNVFFILSAYEVNTVWVPAWGSPMTLFWVSNPLCLFCRQEQISIAAATLLELLQTLGLVRLGVYGLGAFVGSFFLFMFKNVNPICCSLLVLPE